MRALYDWIVDSDEIPHLLIDATVEGVEVPAEHVRDGQIVLNVGPNAVRDLQLGDEYVMFSGRFSGVAMNIALPMASIRAIYARDSAQGMVFPDEEYAVRQGFVGSEPEGPDGGEKAGGPDLRLV